MSEYEKILKREFPSVDDSLIQYVEGILDEDSGDINSCEDIYDAIGDLLHEIGFEKTENNIKEICEEFFKIMKPKDVETRKILNSPVNIAQMAADMGRAMSDVKSIWVIDRSVSNVDSKKLEKAEAKLQQKLEKREQGSKTVNKIVHTPQLATTSQVTSRKEKRLENKGLNRGMDIHIKNFDVAFGEKILLQNADLDLSFNRRYGLVGRNGLGKTTLLRMISEKQLAIPSHITILHVEQEVVGDDTTALDSVLSCDTERSDLLAKEKELVAALNDGVSNMKISEELSEVYAKLQNIEAEKAVAKASIILRGLGFTAEMQKRTTKSYSGGWRMRLALARALFSQPDLLLLDEPTNMLDIKAIIWLEQYLQTWPSTLLVASHDCSFLDAVSTDIIHLHSQRLDSYKGNYEQFCKTKTEKIKAQRREYEAQMQYRAHVQEFIDRFRYNANRASSVQSKIKLLEKLPELKPVEKDTEVKLKFPEVEALNPPVLVLNEIYFSYDGKKNIFNNLSISANSSSRVCIVGENGAGKSTFLQLIIGKLTPTKGTITLHRGLRIGYFAQHHVDHLDMNLDCVSLLHSADTNKTEEECRRVLGSFGITGNTALQLVGSLSGGQKSRVALAKMCLACPNFLILDEPTNHLDIETIASLGKAIKEFKGGAILVSHDERLIRAVCQELWVCENNTISILNDGIDQYKVNVLKDIEDSK